MSSESKILIKRGSKTSLPVLDTAEMGYCLDTDELYIGNNGANKAIGAGSKGYTGSQGIQGVIGYTGSQGGQGINGYTGSQGNDGSIGYTGSQGVQGDTGYIGSQGDLGYSGSKGDQGDIGYVGSQGIQGELGYTGSQGIEGGIGYTGSQGVQGNLGYTGSKGIQGELGYTGSQGIQGELGYTGSQGIEGSIGYTGSQGIEGSIGYTGSQGVQGSIGYTGSQGIQGNLGYTGSSGIQGDLGYSGSQGDLGYTGSKGDQGDLGYTGSQGIGYTGSQGNLGYSGSKGDLGYTGSAGSYGYTPVNKAGDTMTGFLTLNADPTSSLHAVTKQYADSIAAGIKPKGSVIAVTTGPITLYDVQTVDTVVLVAEDRVLVKNQADAKTNGIYIVKAGANWVRSDDCDGTPAGEVVSGITTFCYGGDANHNTSWVLISNDPVTVGSSDLNFTLYSVSGDLTAGAGLARNVNVLNVGAGDGITVNTDSITVNLDGATLTKSGTGLKVTNNTFAPYSHGHGADVITLATTTFDKNLSVAITDVQKLAEAVDEMGVVGYTGSRGTTGYTGSQGVIGYTGSQGSQGFTGYTGSQGIQGNLGYTGSQGIQGGTGYTGSQGIQGATGYTGSQGVQGGIGYTGSQGIQGNIGYTGSQGIQGNLGYTGSQGIQGGIGYTGSQGIQGSIGYTGSHGIQGGTGYTGSQGIQGNLGYTGSQGVGYTGSQGVLGYTGSFGSTGYTGSAGSLGYTPVNKAGDTMSGNLVMNNSYFKLSDSDVAHGVTTLTETNVYGNLSIVSTTGGGLLVQGLTDADSNTLNPLYMRGMHGHASPTGPAISLEACKANGTDIQALANGEMVLQLFNRSTTLMTILGSGNIGIGLTNPAYKLDLYKSASNVDDTLARFRLQPGITSNGTYYHKGVHIDGSNMTITAGVTDGGYHIGLDSSTFANAAGFAGTLSSQRAVWARAGINIAASGAIITSVYGVHAEILNANAGTTITNAYGIYIQNTDTVGTITNRFDLYASSANAKNYFAGSVGIGNTNPQAKLVVSNAGAEGFEVSPESNVVKLYAYDRVGSNYEPFEFKGISHDFKYGASQISAMIITSTGNVGIGVSPTHKLDIALSTGATGIAGININNSSTTGTAYGIIAQATGAATTNIAGYFAGGGATTNYDVYAANATSRNYFAGSVGVGILAPFYGKLEVVKNSSYNVESGNGISIQTGTTGQPELNIGVDSANGVSYIQAYVRDTSINGILCINAGGGNVGIGTLTATQKLTLSGAVSGLPATSGTTQTNGITRIGHSNTNAVLDMGINGTNGVWLQSVSKAALGTNYPLILNPNGGNVGIRTGTATTVSYDLQIGDPTNYTAATKTIAIISDRTNDSSAPFASIKMFNSAQAGGNYSAIEAWRDYDNYGTSLRFSTAPNSAGGFTTERMMINFQGNVGIATSSPTAKLDVASGGLALLIGADDNQITRTNITSKTGRIASPHYTNAEEPVGIIKSNSWSGGNWLDFGGGDSSVNSTNLIRFFTGATATTVTGTERMRIDDAGRIGLGNSTPSQRVDIQGFTSGTPAGSGTSSNAVMRIGHSNTNAVADFGFYDTYGFWIQSTNKTDLSAKYVLRLNPNGGQVILGDSSSVVPGSLSICTVGTAPSGTGNRFGLHITPIASGVVYIDALTQTTGTTALALRGYNNGTYYTFLYGDTNGRVGIGNTAPAQPLDVTGTVKAYNYISSIATGTAPFTITSTTKSTNLNADLFDGLHLHELGVLSVYKTGKDANNIFTTITYKRGDATTYMTSVLSGGTSPQYTTRTETYYDTNGSTVLATKVYTISYDGNGDITSEVVA